MMSLGLAISLCGCSIAGSWKKVSTDPPGAPFPVDLVTFSDDNQYTATWSPDGKPRTSTGEYKWNGRSLQVLQPNAQPRTYRARLGLNGKLVLTYAEGSDKVTATLERAEPAAENGSQP